MVIKPISLYIALSISRLTGERILRTRLRFAVSTDFESPGREVAAKALRERVTIVITRGILPALLSHGRDILITIAAFPPFGSIPAVPLKHHDLSQ
jgi:hypothetical protein